MNKLNYENPIVEILLLSADVIRTSDDFINIGEDEEFGEEYE